MTFLKKDIELPQLIYKLPLFLILIAAGLSGNYFKFPVFLDIDFFFGSIFSMLALQFFGPVPGILAAAVISAYTYVLLNHPYDIIIMTAEVAVVGWLMDRSKTRMVLADTIYWIFIGMPLVYIFFHMTMQVPFSSTFMVMSKQSVNGITNALVSRLIFTAFTLRTRSSLTSFSEIIYNLLAFFVLLPALIMLAIGSRSDFAETDRRIRTTLIQDSQLADQYLETWVSNRQTAVINLANMAASTPPEQMQPFLELSKKSDDNFLYIGLLDRNATTTACFPLFDEMGRNNIGKSFADRPFIQALKQTLKPMLSEVAISYIDTQKSITAMLAPVVIQGQYGGYVTGILSLEQIHDYLNKSVHDNATSYALIDNNGNIIMTNLSDQKAMKPFVRDKGTILLLDSGISQWMPVVQARTPLLERWKKSCYIAETDVGSFSEWKLILEQPVAPYQKTLYDQYTAKLTLLLLILSGALALAELLSRRSMVTLDKLSKVTHGLPARLSTEGKEIPWPASRIKEANLLINNFREMADSLTDQFNKVRQSRDTLKQAYAEVEQRVHERTAELDATNKALTEEIAERKRAEAEKEKMDARNRQLQKAESLGRMAGAIAHHFNNQLHAVMGYLEMVMDSLPPDTKPMNSLISAMQAARKAADVSRLMLTYLGQSAGKHDPLDLSETCRRSLSLLHATTPKEIIIKADFPDSGPVICANAGQILQLLTSLVTNAWESTDENGSISLTIKTVFREDIPALKYYPVNWHPHEKIYACLEVSDTGCGIPIQDMDKIFDPFFTTKFPGRGLGLPVVMGITRAHNGGMTVESTPGQGSVFRVFIPVLPEKAPCLPEHADKASDIAYGGTVLLVEDEEQVREMVKDMLTHLGHGVLTAKNGFEAVDLFTRNKDQIVCVLCDLTMPSIDGWKTLIELRKLSPGIPVILTSGYDEAQVMAAEHTERPNAFLGKPYELKELDDTIRRVLATDV